MRFTQRWFLCALLPLLVSTACSQTSSTQTLPAPAVGPVSSANAAGLAFRTYTAGKSPGLPANAQPLDITRGPDGALWFTDAGVPAIGRITTDGKIAEYTAGLQDGARPYAIAPAPDGTLWFSDVNGGVGSITTTGVISEVLLPKSSPLGPDGIAAASDGSTWSIALGSPDALVHVRGTHYALGPIPAGIKPDGSLAIDAHDNLWMLAMQNAVGILLERTARGTYRTYPTPLVPAATICCPNYSPTRMTIGANGDLWFTTLYWLSNRKPTGKVIGKHGSGGATTFYKVESKPVHYPAYASGITSSGNDVWFAGDDPLQVNGALWHIGPNGNQAVYPIPYDPVSLARDAKGDLWITGEGFNDPGQIVEAILPHDLTISHGGP